MSEANERHWQDPAYRARHYNDPWRRFIINPKKGAINKSNELKI
ncbi:hypothetical protein RPYSC3_48160 [Rhodopseudomonas palustris]|nr:hypothetical protein RPYSC3_48160 [Rhodopseudomonas palustris]